MKSFAFTARDASGATTRGHLSADDRAAAIREIRARGLVPLSIEEGAAPAGSGSRRSLPGARIIALAVAALLAVVALVVLLTHRPAATPPAVGTSATQPTAPASPDEPWRGRAEPAAPASPDEPGRGRAAPEAPVAPATPAPKLPASASPGTGAATAATPEPETPPPPPPERVYKTATEQLLAMLGRPGESMPPLPITGDEDFSQDLKAALTNLITIYETDDAHAVNRKETVAWLKVQLAEAEKEGWNPAEVIKALEAQRREEVAIREEAARRFQEMRRENPDKAREIREAINAELAEKGILPLDPPIRRRRQSEK